MFNKYVLTLFISWNLHASVPGPNLPDEGIVTKDVDSFYDPGLDYSQFPARVTDKDIVGNILKLQSETRNVKFFKAGDKVTFNVADKPDYPECTGYVRGVEDQYFVLYVADVNQCWIPNAYFRRGTLLSCKSDLLEKRVRDASKYRLLVLQRKKDYLEQLNQKNKFLWAYKEKQIQVAAEYDKRLVAVRKQKQKALDNLITEKKQTALLQRELIKKLDEVDRDLEFYKVEREELFADRWILDQDTVAPVKRRPLPEKQVKKKSRWHDPAFQ